MVQEDAFDRLFRELFTPEELRTLLNPDLEDLKSEYLREALEEAAE